MQRLQLGGVETLVALMAASRRQGDVGAEPREGREPKYRPGLREPRTCGGLTCRVPVPVGLSGDKTTRAGVNDEGLSRLA